MKFNREPAVYLSLLAALIMLATSFGLKLAGEQVNAINTVAAIVIPLLLGVTIRSQVSPASDVITALDMPKGSTEADLQKEIAKQN